MKYFYFFDQTQRSRNVALPRVQVSL